MIALVLAPNPRYFSSLGRRATGRFRSWQRPAPAKSIRKLTITESRI